MDKEYIEYWYQVLSGGYAPPLLWFQCFLRVAYKTSKNRLT